MYLEASNITPSKKKSPTKEDLYRKKQSCKSPKEDLYRTIKILKAKTKILQQKYYNKKFDDSSNKILATTKEQQTSKVETKGLEILLKNLRKKVFTRKI